MNVTKLEEGITYECYIIGREILDLNDAYLEEDITCKFYIIRRGYFL